MKFKKNISLALFLFLFLALGGKYSFANDFTYVAELSFFSDYYKRGISQTREKPAPQLLAYGLHNDTGLYGGIFASRVEFFDQDEADQELDYYFGITKSIDHWHLNFFAIYFTYLGANSALNYDFLEFDATVGYDFKYVFPKLNLKLAPNLFGDSGLQTYTTLSADVPLAEDLIGTSHISYRSIEDNAAFGLPDSFDWSLGLKYDLIPQVELSGQYVDSSFNEKTECVDICDERVIAGITYKFVF